MMLFLFSHFIVELVNLSAELVTLFILFLEAIFTRKMLVSNAMQKELDFTKLYYRAKKAF